MECGGKGVGEQEGGFLGQGCNGLRQNETVVVCKGHTEPLGLGSLEPAQSGGIAQEGSRLGTTVDFGLAFLELFFLLLRLAISSRIRMTAKGRLALDTVAASAAGNEARDDYTIANFHVDDVRSNAFN